MAYTDIKPIEAHSGVMELGDYRMAQLRTIVRELLRSPNDVWQTIGRSAFPRCIAVILAREPSAQLIWAEEAHHSFKLGLTWEGDSRAPSITRRYRYIVLWFDGERRALLLDSGSNSNYSWNGRSISHERPEPSEFAVPNRVTEMMDDAYTAARLIEGA